ncbi:MAG TPA: hypothetical protein VKV73_26100 [Chloroflexota bacterium]|nr:hypothetical protein [Chloroflexota bacterium]
MTGPSKLLVISGPIAAGKSTVAAALAAAYRDSGRTAAVVDLDRIYMMLDDRPPMTDPRISRQARGAAAALTDHFVGFQELGRSYLGSYELVWMHLQIEPEPQ